MSPPNRFGSSLDFESDQDVSAGDQLRGSAAQISVAMVQTLGKLLYQMKRMSLVDSRETLFAEAAKVCRSAG